MTCRSSSNSIINTIELEKARLRREHPDWSPDQLQQVFTRCKQDVLSYLVDSTETPRSLQQDLADGSGLELTYDGSWGSTDADLLTTNFGLTDELVPTPMARSNRSTLGFELSPPVRSFSGSSTCSKRDYCQIDMVPSASYTYGSNPSQHVSSVTAPSMVNQRLEAIESYEPAEYMMKLSSDFDRRGTEPSISKRQRFDVSDTFHQPTTPTVDPMFSFDVMPSSSMRMTLLSPGTPTISEAMSRQSNLTNSSLINGVDMLSLCPFSSVVASTCPSVSAGEDREHSFHSCSTEKAADGRPPNMPIHEAGGSRLFCNLDEGSTNFHFSAVGQTFPDVMNDEEQSVGESVVLSDASAEEMQRSDSDQSTISTTSGSSVDCARQKDIDRRRKHIENGKQAIAMKNFPSGPRATFSSTDLNGRPIKALQTSSKRKEAIVKAPYVRPSHPKLFCDQCTNYPDGFKGDHELRRHRDRAHATRRKVWICTQPATQSEPGPESPLEICKYCRNGKTFNADYNAAAHLRRVHFFPCKRGRTPRGVPRASRAGKAGGDKPSIDWLKATGYLKEIEVPVAPLPPLPKLLSPDTAVSLSEAGSFPPADLGIDYSADALGFGTAVVHAPGDDLDLPSLRYEAPPPPPPQQQQQQQRYDLYYCDGTGEEARMGYGRPSCVGRS